MRVIKILIIIPVILFIYGMKEPNMMDTTREYQLKAVFLFNFTQFVTWPANSFEDNRDPFIIGILGENPYGTFLDETVRGESVNGHRIVVRRYKDIEDVKTCHILYINIKNNEELADVLTKVKDRNILTVGDSVKFTQLGGIVGFFITNNKVGLKINLGAASATDLAISSKLLRLATIVKSKK